MDDALKQRLVGASVLVVLAVIFLPLLLDGSGMAKSGSEMSLGLPESEQGNTVTITLKPKAQEAEPPKPVASPKPVQKKLAPVVVKPEKVVKTVKKPQPVKPAKVTASQGQQWVVQLGSFTQRSNAQALRDQLINKGYKSFVEVSGQGKGQVFRVRVGPVSTRELAEKMQSKLKNTEQRKALVMAYP